MFRVGRTTFFALCMSFLGSPSAWAVEPIGQAVHIRTSVTGGRGELAVRDPVFRDERIRTSRSGLGEFKFNDGTKLSVGWGSSVVIDRFIYDDNNSLKKLTLKAAKGTFRWVSGNSKSTAYEILTPAGTIGVRGTVFDFYVGPDGTTAMVLLNGAASFCGAGGCKQLTRPCECVVASRGGRVSDPQRVDRDVLRRLGNSRALPFLSGDQRLAGNLFTRSCGLRAALQRNETREQPPRRIQPPPPPKPPKPEKPLKPPKPMKVDRPSWDRPDKEKLPGRDKPDFDRPDVTLPDAPGGADRQANGRSGKKDRHDTPNRRSDKNRNAMGGKSEN